VSTPSAGTLIPMVDTHVHFFDHAVPGFTWGWLDSSFQQFGDTYLLDAPRFTAQHDATERAAVSVSEIELRKGQL
jgi:hypothetical protein